MELVTVRCARKFSHDYMLVPYKKVEKYFRSFGFKRITRSFAEEGVFPIRKAVFWKVSDDWYVQIPTDTRSDISSVPDSVIANDMALFVEQLQGVLGVGAERILEDMWGMK